MELAPTIRRTTSPEMQFRESTSSYLCNLLFVQLYLPKFPGLFWLRKKCKRKHGAAFLNQTSASQKPSHGLLNLN